MRVTETGSHVSASPHVGSFPVTLMEEMSGFQIREDDGNS